ncbi:MAG: hypothetical protein KA715_10020 [Xanthomonadaceae bacterium]|nr:hypothetical protein [Xanthomonadaceae bacterium]
MKKLSSAVVIFLMSSVFSQADMLDRRSLTSSDLDRISKDSGPDAYKNLDIYLNRAIAIKYKKKTLDKVKSDTKIVHNKAEDIQKVIITDSIKLRILSITDQNLRIFVSFDPQCNSQECALSFGSDGKQYYLSDVPEKKGYEDSVTKSVIPLLIFPRVPSSQRSSGKRKYDYYKHIHLVVSKKNIHKITKKTEKAKGY